MKVHLEQFNKDFEVSLPTFALVKEYQNILNTRAPFCTWIKERKNGGWVYSLATTAFATEPVGSNPIETYAPQNYSTYGDVVLLFVPLTDDGMPDLGWMHTAVDSHMNSKSPMIIGAWYETCPEPFEVVFCNNDDPNARYNLFAYATDDGFLMRDDLKNMSYKDIIRFAPLENFTPDPFGVATEIDGEPVLLELPDHAADPDFVESFLNKVQREHIKNSDSIFWGCAVPGLDIIDALRKKDIYDNFEYGMVGKPHTLLHWAPVISPINGSGMDIACSEDQQFPCCSLYRNGKPLSKEVVTMNLAAWTSGEITLGEPTENRNEQIDGMWHRGKLYLLCPMFYATAEELGKFLKKKQPTATERDTRVAL